MKRLSAIEKIFKLFAYVFIGTFALIALYPVIYALSASISSKLAYESGQIILWPKGINFKAYDVIIYDKAFWISYTNTLFYTFFGTLWSMGISSLGAYVLSKRKLLFKRNLNFLLVFTMWFNAGMIPTYLNYVNMGVANRWGIVFAFGVQAFNIILLRNYFEAVPKEIEEAARIDGANEFQIFSKVYVPMSKAALATVTLFYATSRWNGYFWSRLLLTNTSELPLQVYLRMRVEDFQAIFDEMPLDIPYSADSLVYAMIICSIIPVLIIYPFIQKYFARGVNVGGVKG